MASFVPFIQVDEITNDGERVVAEALDSQLPGDCIVFHSYPWVREERLDQSGKSILKEGEADFVVVFPQAGGFLILEVKGGHISHDPETLEWHRRLDNGRLQETTDPFKQAHDSMHHLKAAVLQHGYPGRDELPISYGYAVFFPDCAYEGPPPRNAERIMILDASDLSQADRRLHEVMRKWSRKNSPKVLQKSDIDAIKKGLMPSFHLIPALSRRIDAEEEQLVRMTEEQMRLLDYLGNHNRVAIEGVAGSGKTLLALTQARRFAEQGHKTLLICYNKGLSEWLRNRFPKSLQDRVEVGHFHSMAARWCQQAGLPFKVEGDYELFWRERAPELLLEAAGKLSLEFDAIVVDEGQDFEPIWWEFIDLLFSPGGPRGLYIFYDPAQNLYLQQGPMKLPVQEAPFQLSTNCRNTVAIATHCGQLIGRQISVRPAAPRGEKCVSITVPTTRDAIQRCEQYVQQWVVKGGLKAHQVAILGPRSKPNSSLDGVAMIAGTTIVDKLVDWESGNGILYSTIRSFKGLEADAILLIDLQEIDKQPHFTKSDVYVASSRAKHLLVTITVADQPSPKK